MPAFPRDRLPHYLALRKTSPFSAIAAGPLLVFSLLLLSVFGLHPAGAQDYDPAWYDPARSYVKIGVVEDGIYRITGADLANAGVPLSAVTQGSIKLYENGKQIPLWYRGNGNVLEEDAEIIFVGKRNRGTEENWAYNDTPAYQSSTFFSLFSDTTYYWFTWGGSQGRRYVLGDEEAPASAVEVFRDTLHFELDQTYYLGDGTNARHPLYTRGEGFYWRSLTHRNTAPQSISHTGTLAGLARTGTLEDTVYVRVRLNGGTPTPHRVALEVNTIGDGGTAFRTFDEVAWSGYAFRTLQAAIPAEDIPVTANNRLELRVTSFNEANANPNIVYVDWIDTSYLRAFTAQAGALRFFLPDAAPSQLTLNGFNDGSLVVLSPEEARRYAPTSVGGEATFSVGSDNPTLYWAAHPTALRTPVSFRRDQASNWAAATNEADYLIVTTPSLRASAEALAEYHRTHNGFTVAIADIQDVFDQFDYGRATPVAIRRFVRQTLQWATPPRFLMIWADALQPSRTRARFEWEVPSIGFISPSDGWFGTQIENAEDWSEALAIGRVPVRDDEQGLLFIDKLRAYEAAPFEAWQKRMVAMVGGFSPTEQAILQNNMDRWATKALSPPVGMDTLRFYKVSTEPSDRSFTDSLRVAFQEGASWVAYFGHSAAVTWDIVTDPPEEFENENRLPVAISLGCLTGAFSSSSPDLPPVFAEQLLLNAPSGAIAHWGSSGLSSVSGAARISDILHDLVFTDTLRTLGIIFQEVKRLHDASSASDLREHLQFNLLGDPATRLALPTRPDFHLTQEQLFITPEAPIPADSILSVTVRLQNFGTVPVDSLTLELIHTSPAGAVTSYTARVPPFALEQDVVFPVRLSEALIGDNRFRVTVDPGNAVEEESEENNTSERTHVVFSTGLSLITPNPYGAVQAGSPIRLRVAFATAEVTASQVFFELDTSPTFDSPDLRTFNTVTSKAFAVWEVTDPLPSERVYYWRARIDLPDEPVQWKQASFFVRDGGAQQAWFQEGVLFDDASLEGLTRQGDRWMLDEFNVELEIRSTVPNTPVFPTITVDGNAFDVFDPGYGLLVLNGATGAVREHLTAVTFENRLGVDPVAETDSLINLVEEAETGDYVFVRTWPAGRTGSVEIADRVKDVFRSLGSTAIDTLTYEHLWILMARKGFPEEVQEWVSTSTITREATFFFLETEGTLRSPAVGPAQRWHTLSWSADLPNETSQVHIDVLDARTNMVLQANITDPSLSVDLSSIDARAHPFLRLQATLADPTQRATPQLTRWEVAYTATPEVLIDASTLSLSADTLQEGQPLTVSTSVLNFSESPVDALVVQALVTDASNRTTLVASDTLHNLAAEAASSVSFDLDTDGLLGQNRLTLRAEQPDLVEVLTSNNTLITGFTVRGDQDPPMLRVTIDGEELPPDPDPIRDLQDPNIPLLSTRPTIEIVFSDDNPYKLLTDTTFVVLTLDDESLPFSRPDIQFEPATGPQNQARILYTPDFTGEDAVHTLRVQVFDASGNEAEESPYQIHFRITSTFKVESLYPYPNPMNSFTQFAFLLQAADPSVVEDFRIRIYTLTGRVVREFDLLEDPSLLRGGLLRIGWNTVPWDGRDEDGDLLATGVYLYKVFLKSEGQTVEVNNGSSVEKLVIIR